MYRPTNLGLCLITILAFGILSPLSLHAELPKTGGAGNPNFNPEDHLLKQAKKDDKKAQLELALCYLISKYSVEPDADEAIYWLTRAASQDKRSISKKLPPHPRALLYLGFCHENPMYADYLELKIDRKKALHFYLLAENRGYKEAAQYIAKTYRALSIKAESVKNEDGSIKNKAEALKYKAESIKYFKKAAELKIPSCQVEYAKLLLTGDGVKKDPKSAISHLENAGRKGSGEAYLLLADVYSGSFDEVPQNSELMIDSLWQAASTRADAMTRIGYCYLHGIGLPQDKLLAFKWYKKAATADRPDVNARIAVARCYSQGIGVKKDLQQAFENYLLASSEPNAPAIASYNVALSYIEGRGVKKDINQAFNYLSKAAEKKFPMAWVMLGKLYEKGNVSDKDDNPLPASAEKAFEFFSKAAKVNDVGGMVQQGRCYYKGIGVDVDKKTGASILRKAAKIGSREAIQLLVEFGEPLVIDAKPEKAAPTPEKKPKTTVKTVTPKKVAPKKATVDVGKPLMQF